jgi:cell division protease FtsH
MTKMYNKPPNGGGNKPNPISMIFGAAAMGASLYMMYKQMKQMEGGVKSPTIKKATVAQKEKVTFKDVAGIDEVVEEVQEIVDFLKNPGSYQTLGAKVPKGALLVGPPGTGKTLLARATAGEAGVPFFKMAGSEFVEKFVGVGASRVRDLFTKAKQNAPCIVFIDEIDAVGGHRGNGRDSGHQEREQTLNQILVEMDGFDATTGVIVMAATNRADILDPALTRAGRFDRQLNVGLPDVNGREKILNVHMQGKKFANNVDVRTIARGTPRFSGADLANLCNEAALIATRRKKTEIDTQDLEDAKDKIMMGPEKRSLKMSDKERELTAYHEAGHAIVALNTPGSDPVHKATIMPRGRALGMVVRLPERDKLSQTKQELKSHIAVAMGGRVAEIKKFGHEHVTTGAASDIDQATKIAWAMVTEYGMSDKLGRVRYSASSADPRQPRNIDGEALKLVNKEVEELITEGEASAQAILDKHEQQWELLAQALLEHETLSGKQIQKLLKDGSLPSAAPSQPAAKPVKKGPKNNGPSMG